MSDAPSGVDCHEQNRREGPRRCPKLLKDGGADLDRFFDALGERRRRLVLLHLNETDSADLDQLAKRIAEHEEVETDDEKIEQIRVNLHHQQLPKLTNHGLVSYDPRTKKASLEPLPEAVEKILDLTQDLEASDTR